MKIYKWRGSLYQFTPGKQPVDAEPVEQPVKRKTTTTRKAGK